MDRRKLSIIAAILLTCMFFVSIGLVASAIHDVEIHTIALAKGKYSKVIEEGKVYRPGK
jgi:predicted membrane protein